MNYLVLDIENNNNPKTQYGREAGNFLYDEIIAIGAKRANNIDPVYQLYGTGSIYQLEWILNNYYIDILVGHNIKHDLLFLWKNDFLQTWFKQGGKVWDTAIVEYILTGQQHKYPALRDIAVNKYGCKEREKLCESYWEKGIQTSDIPRQLVITDVTNDVLDTEQVFLLQQIDVYEEGILSLIESEMDFLLACCEIEYNGMKINKDIFDQNKTKLQNELEQKHIQLQLLCKDYLK